MDRRTVRTMFQVNHRTSLEEKEEGIQRNEEDLGIHTKRWRDWQRRNWRPSL